MANLTMTLQHGAILSVLASVALMAMMKVNPRLMMQDYPQAIQDTVPPKTAAEKRLGLWLGMPFLLVLVVFPLWSTWTLHRQLGASSTFLALVWHAAVVLLCFNVVDWLVLDWLFFCTWTPAFMVISGSEGSPAYKDYGYHFRGFLIGSAICIAGALVMAALVWFLT